MKNTEHTKIIFVLFRFFVHFRNYLHRFGSMVASLKITRKFNIKIIRISKLFYNFLIQFFDNFEL